MASDHRSCFLECRKREEEGKDQALTAGHTHPRLFLLPEGFGDLLPIATGDRGTWVPQNLLLNSAPVPGGHLFVFAVPTQGMAGTALRVAGPLWKS